MADDFANIDPFDPLEQRRELQSVLSSRVELKPGDRVLLRPRAGADIFDMALSGRIATIVAIEQDYENCIHLAVAVEDDPGKDLGHQGRPGHRFYFRLDEVEPVSSEDPKP